MVTPQTMTGAHLDHTPAPVWQHGRSEAVDSYPVLNLILSGREPTLGVEFVAPLEVEISREEDYWTAISPSVAVSGAGDTPPQALTDFIEILTDRYRWLSGRSNLGPALQDEFFMLSLKLRLL